MPPFSSLHDQNGFQWLNSSKSQYSMSWSNLNKRAYRLPCYLAWWNYTADGNKIICSKALFGRHASHVLTHMLRWDKTVWSNFLFFFSNCLPIFLAWQTELKSNISDDFWEKLLHVLTETFPEISASTSNCLDKDLLWHLFYLRRVSISWRSPVISVT